MSDAFDALCAEAGIAWRYKDGSGIERSAPIESSHAILNAMGIKASGDREAAEQLQRLTEYKASRILPHWIVTQTSRPVSIQIKKELEWRLQLETGEIREGKARNSIELEPLPAGYHAIWINGQKTDLLGAPARLPLPGRCWGIMMPLYGLKPDGFGDYGDLTKAIKALAASGSSFIGINPVHAGFPKDPGACSPYSPSSRRRLNISHIASGSVPVFEGELIDYHNQITSKLSALRKEYSAYTGSSEFERYLEKEGPELRQFAVHQVLSNQFGPYWTDWPVEYQNPGSDYVCKLIEKSHAEIRFHSWLQFIAEKQLAEASKAAANSGMKHGLYLDLAVGTHPSGAETWIDRKLFAQGVSLGAPPDSFSPTGQTWGLAPMIPQALEQRGFEPLAETLRRQLAFAGILRIDHILGFERAYWVPDGLPGAYVAMPKQAMLAVVRIEAERAGAAIVGEDLGNVPDGLRTDLKKSGILGCKVAMFERQWDTDRSFIQSNRYPPASIASFNTHDLPTWIGWRKGNDIKWRAGAGQIDEAKARIELEERHNETSAFDEISGGSDFVALCRFLAESGSRLVGLQIEDILGLEEQANLPGTITEHPNWRRRLPLSVAEIAKDGRLKKTAAIMTEAKR